MTIEKLKAKTTPQLAELGKKTNVIKQLKKELAENKLTSVALEARTKTLRDQLRATEKDLRLNQTRSSKRTVNSPTIRLSWRRCGRTRQAIARRELILVFDDC